MICLSISSKYPIEEIIRDYKSGYSFSELHDKYGISMNSAWRVVREKLGKTRSISEAQLLRNKGWRRLPRVGTRRKKHSTRIVSIPFQLLKKLGFKQDDVLVAKWKVSEDHLELSVKKISTCETTAS